MFAEEIIIPSLAIIGFFASIILSTYLFFRTRYRIRMALIEHDKTAEIFNQDESGSAAFKQGLVAVLVGMGLLVGYFLEGLGMEGFVAYASMILIFGGAGLLAFYRMKGQGRLDELA